MNYVYQNLRKYRRLLTEAAWSEWGPCQRSAVKCPKNVCFHWGIREITCYAPTGTGRAWINWIITGFMNIFMGWSMTGGLNRSSIPMGYRQKSLKTPSWITFRFPGRRFGSGPCLMKGVKSTDGRDWGAEITHPVSSVLLFPRWHRSGKMKMEHLPWLWMRYARWFYAMMRS